MAASVRDGETERGLCRLGDTELSRLGLKNERNDNDIIDRHRTASLPHTRK